MRTYQINEIFGPTSAGEGLIAGQLAAFVRLLLCDGDGSGHRCRFCLGEHTRISMASGKAKFIKDIKVGDSVLTVDLKTGAFVQDTVTAIMQRKVGKAYSISLHHEKTKSNKRRLVVTGNHPVFVPKRGWVPVNDLNIGDELYHVSRAELSSYMLTVSNPMFDSAVAARVGKQVSKRTKGVPHSSLWRKRLSSARKQHNPMRDDPAVASRNAIAHQIRPTKIERYVIAIAKDLGISLKYVGIRKFWINGQNPDFLVTGQNKVIEVYDPTYPRKIPVDEYIVERPKAYLKEGYKCLMLPVNLRYEYRDTEGIQKLAVTKIITDFVRNGSRVTAVRRISTKDVTWKRRSHGEDLLTVYNFETKNTHTYLADGLLVHNCDTRYSWDPAHPLYKAEKLTADEIISKLDDLKWGGDAHHPWVTVTGGNPLVQLSQEKDELMLALQDAGYRTFIETQGTIWKESAKLAAGISVSPKPPSAGMSLLPAAQISRWAKNAVESQQISYKFVVSDEADFKWVEELSRELLTDVQGSPAQTSFYLQSCTPLEGDPVEGLLTGYRWLVERWLASPLEDFVVLPQLHVLLWGRKTGV